MKNIKFLMYLFIVSAFFIFAASCNTPSKDTDNDAVQTETSTSNDEKTAEEEHSEAQKHDEMATASYQCPMKCEGDKTYTEKEKCPKCGMEMEEVKN